MELLCPAGSFESLKAAVQNGADSVYFGGSGFNARRFADDMGDLKEAVTYAHARGCKAYFTLNTLILDRELKKWTRLAEEAARSGVDAFIVQDLGGAHILKAMFPDIPLHASTQMTIHNSDTAKALGEFGFSRLILARELTAEQIRRIKGNTAASVEVFAHGAVCFSYSGQCLMSSMLGGRSANRGVCAQPCRLPYSCGDKHGYLLSTKDLCLLGHIEELREAGVDCIKIEGRMKRPEYVAAVASAYRKAIDGEKVGNEMKDMLALVFNRGRFTAGMFAQEEHRLYQRQPDHIGIDAGRVLDVKRDNITVQSKFEIIPGDDIAPATPDAKAAKVLQVRQSGNEQMLALNNGSAFKTGMRFNLIMRAELMRSLNRAVGLNSRKQKVRAGIMIKKDEPVMLEAGIPGGASVSVAGDVPEPAVRLPLTRESVCRQLSKTGDYPFEFTGIETDIDDGLSLPLSSLNALRRKALEALIKEIADQYMNRRALAYTPAQGCIKQVYRKPRLAAQVYTKEQALAVKDSVDILYLPADAGYAGELENACAVHAYLQLITSDGELCELKPLTEGFNGVMMNSLLEISNVKIADYGFNVTNSETLAVLGSMGFVRVTLSPELNCAQIRDIAVPEGMETEVIAYGRHMLMTSAHCPIDCGGKSCVVKAGKAYLKDRKGAVFPLVRQGENGRVGLLNSVPLFMADRLDDITADVLRLVFTVESPDECADIALMYRGALEGPSKKPVFNKEYTRGHFNRGLGEKYES